MKIADSSQIGVPASTKLTGIKAYITIAVLSAINMLVYMDRYTVAGILTKIQKYYSLDDSEAGLLQTTFLVFYMISSPISGYLGDRYNRKYIMTLGLIVWVISVFTSTFFNKNAFIGFLLVRNFGMGFGEATIAVIAPTLIADLFNKKLRSKALMIFYFATPVGSGLGYMTGSFFSSLFGSWEWGLRITPLLGILCIVLIIFVLEEPERGQSEKELIQDDTIQEKKSTYWKDFKYLCGIKTYIFATLGSATCLYVVGSLSFFAPTAIEYYHAVQKGYKSLDEMPNDDKNEISFIFGALTCGGGLAGVTLGGLISMWWKNGQYFFPKSNKADALVCAFGSLFSMPFLYMTFGLIQVSSLVTYTMIFFTVFFLCANTSVICDMTLSIIVPGRRSIAYSWQILISHLLGDCSGPYLIGLISDWVRGKETSPKAHFDSLKTAFYVAQGYLLISFITFGVSSLYVTGDKEKYERDCGMLLDEQNQKNIEIKVFSKSIEDAK
uniref:MFS domain-containing protein n=1 Tax=Rhabditophanes sp. KR3021 TaxID=114890 RepID=A0AC35UG03_9BILA